MDEVEGWCPPGWWDRGHTSRAPGYPWQPCEQQPPSGTVAVHDNTVEMN